MAAGGAAAAAIAMANAAKASGGIVTVAIEDFQTILRKSEKPLVVCAQGGFFSKQYKYLTSYKGLVFYSKSSVPLEFSPTIELVLARKIWIPS